MPIIMPSDTRAVLGENAEKCESRSLFLDRFARPEAKDNERRKWFEHLIRKAPVAINRRPMVGRTNRAPLYAQVQSRLMVNMAGGVMENAGLCLDRFGLPYIPGSAVKGCARRMAIQQLLEVEASSKPGLLVQIAMVFGWGEQDWSDAMKGGRFKSDFAYAVGAELWPGVSIAAKQSLAQTSHFAGTVSFLPSHPVDVSGAELPHRSPTLGALELDVVTCHHPAYYQNKKPVAIDDEDPNPVVFPSVAAGHVFAFSVLPLRNCTDELLHQAREWLANGLVLFGVGAKTAAGYGWFDCSDAIQDMVSQNIVAREKLAAERIATMAAAKAIKEKEEAALRLKREQRAAMANLTPEQQEDYKVSQLTPDQFRSAMDNFASKSAEEQKAIVRALRLDAAVPGNRRSFWEDIKAKAAKKGGKPAQTEQAIRQLSKLMIPGREGKMP